LRTFGNIWEHYSFKLRDRIPLGLLDINVVILLFGCGNGSQYQRVRYLQSGAMGLQAIVDPGGKNGRFHRRGPRLRKPFHPSVQIGACSGKGTFCVNRVPLASFTQ
jgi:hypothetical protein